MFKDRVLGRVYTVHPNQTEAYHMRLLLHTVCGPRTFEELRTFNGIVCLTYKAACLARGLLEDDRNWETTLDEAVLCDSPQRIRELFVTMIVFCQVPFNVNTNERGNDIMQYASSTYDICDVFHLTFKPPITFTSEDIYAFHKRSWARLK